MTDEQVEGAALPGYSPHEENYAKRLRRVEGQVRGIATMIEDDRGVGRHRQAGQVLRVPLRAR
jgi:metal-sensitive transcriptional repressor